MCSQVSVHRGVPLVLSCQVLSYILSGVWGCYSLVRTGGYSYPYTRQGYPKQDRRVVGYPPPGKATPWAVRLLGSHRRTFLSCGVNRNRKNGHRTFPFSSMQKPAIVHTIAIVQLLTCMNRPWIDASISEFCLHLVEYSTLFKTKHPFKIRFPFLCSGFEAGSQPDNVRIAGHRFASTVTHFVSQLQPAEQSPPGKSDQQLHAVNLSYNSTVSPR